MPSGGNEDRSRSTAKHDAAAVKKAEQNAAEKAVRDKEEEMKKKSLEAALAVAVISKETDQAPSPTTTIPLGPDANFGSSGPSEKNEANSGPVMDDDQRNNELLRKRFFPTKK